MSHLTHSHSAGNTIKPRQIKNLAGRKRARIWCFTLNNPNPSELSQLSQEKFFGGSQIIKYLAQEEVGENGTPHLQGTVQFKNQVDFSTLKKINARAHWTKTKLPQQSFRYCGKLKTRCGEIFAYGDVSKYIEKEPETESEFMVKLREQMTGYAPDQKIPYVPFPTGH